MRLYNIYIYIYIVHVFDKVERKFFIVCFEQWNKFKQAMSNIVNGVKYLTRIFLFALSSKIKIKFILNFILITILYKWDQLLMYKV